jgi:hypothetical protein
MSTFKLGPGDVSTLNEGADLAVAAAKAAKREAKKAFLAVAEREAETLEGYGEEAKTFLKNIERGQAELSKGHVDALATGVRILYAQVGKLREKELLFTVNTEGSDVRLQEIRDTFHKLRTNIQLEIEDEEEAAAQERETVGAGA